MIGTLSKTAGTFVIDHPDDPTNKELVHSLVESPEMKNIYDGVAVADNHGDVIVELPGYFESLNKDIRYLLTPLDSPAPELHIKHRLSAGRFTVGGAKPGQAICWQVTGVRQDAYALAHPIVVEPAKPPEHRGLYRHPVEHGQPPSMGVNWQPGSTSKATTRHPIAPGLPSTT